MKHGAGINPHNPFERFHFEEDQAAVEELRRVDPDWEPPRLRTHFFEDSSRSIISKNESPDLSFDASLNPYRGCEHGCSYCYARRYHEFLGFNAGLDFETKIMVKRDAPELLRGELSSTHWKPKKVALSGATDCYQPVERRLEITRGCLSVLAEFRNPVVVITKNHLVTRDLDHLVELARWQAAAVLLSITTLDSLLAREMEPRASSPSMRLRAVQSLADAGVPVGVSIAPVIPGLNETEIPAILDAAKKAGASFATYSLVRLPGAGGAVFEDWLSRHVSSEKKRTILGRIRSTHGGHLNASQAFDRMRGSGIIAEQIAQMFKVCSRRLGFKSMRPEVATVHFRRPGESQLSLGL